MPLKASARRKIREANITVISVLVLLFSFEAAWAHGGGLDSFGCHHNRRLGGYHCHRGRFAGQAFASKEEMLKKFREQEKDSIDEECVKEKSTERIVCGPKIK